MKIYHIIHKGKDIVKTKIIFFNLFYYVYPMGMNEYTQGKSRYVEYVYKYGTLTSEEILCHRVINVKWIESKVPKEKKIQSSIPKFTKLQSSLNFFSS